MKISFGPFSNDFVPWAPSYGQVFKESFSLAIGVASPSMPAPPDYVLAAATNGTTGVFLTPGTMAMFWSAHATAQIAIHGAAEALAVLNKLFRRREISVDVYQSVEHRRIRDTYLLHRLHGLATVGETYQEPERTALGACTKAYLGIHPQVTLDVHAWKPYGALPAGRIPTNLLERLGQDALGTHGVFKHLEESIVASLRRATEAFGYVDPDWLESSIRKYGPQTHDLQLMASVALNAIERIGIGLDVHSRDAAVMGVEKTLASLKEELFLGGYLVGEPGSDKALAAILRRTRFAHPDVNIPDIPDGCAPTGEALENLASVSGFFRAFKEYEELLHLRSTYLSKMHTSRVHPNYDPLKTTGRTSARAPSIQNFPRIRPGPAAGRDLFDLRRCFIPTPGKVFYVADYVSVELRTLAQSVITQFRTPSAMATALKAGIDLHRYLAAEMKLSKNADAAAIRDDVSKLEMVMAGVTDDERDAAKPANFGLPAGMGPPTLASYARSRFGQDFSVDDAIKWREIWRASYPEMEVFLHDDHALRLARELELTPRTYWAETGATWSCHPMNENLPDPILGYMALKVARDANPKTTDGREYSADVVAYFWARLGRLAHRLTPGAGLALRNRRAGPALANEIRNLCQGDLVFTATGRLRAKADYSAQRNTVFQGLAADAAKLGLYRLWRAGFDVVAFIHDEVVLEIDESSDLNAVKTKIDGILIQVMQEICPDVAAEVKGEYRRRWGKDPADRIPVLPRSLNQ